MKYNISFEQIKGMLKISPFTFLYTNDNDFLIARGIFEKIEDFQKADFKIKGHNHFTLESHILSKYYMEKYAKFNIMEILHGDDYFLDYRERLICLYNLIQSYDLIKSKKITFENKNGIKILSDKKGHSSIFFQNQKLQTKPSIPAIVKTIDMDYFDLANARIKETSGRVYKIFELRYILPERRIAIVKLRGKIDNFKLLRQSLESILRQEHTHDMLHLKKFGRQILNSIFNLDEFKKYGFGVKEIEIRRIDYYRDIEEHNWNGNIEDIFQSFINDIQKNPLNIPRLNYFYKIILKYNNGKLKSSPENFKKLFLYKT
jgi:hypothetical protein